MVFFSFSLLHVHLNKYEVSSESWAQDLAVDMPSRGQSQALRPGASWGKKGRKSCFWQRVFLPARLLATVAVLAQPGGPELTA